LVNKNKACSFFGEHNRFDFKIIVKCDEHAIKNLPAEIRYIVEYQSFPIWMMDVNPY